MQNTADEVEDVFNILFSNIRIQKKKKEKRAYILLEADDVHAVNKLCVHILEELRRNLGDSLRATIDITAVG